MIKRFLTDIGSYFIMLKGMFTRPENMRMYWRELMQENYPFSELANKDVNTLIFPNLAAGNIAYNLLKEVGAADAIGPILLGLKKPVHVLQLGSSVRSIVNMALVAVIDAQIKCKTDVQTEINRSRWWKRFKKSKESTDQDKR